MLEVFDILNELDEAGKLRNRAVGGYVVKTIEQPPIFTNEELDPDGKFIDFKIIYIQDRTGKRTLSAGNLVAFVHKDLEVGDFFELTGTLSFGGFDYTRMVTMMVFKKKEIEGMDKPIWVVSPVKAEDIDISQLTDDVYRELMIFAESPLSYKNAYTEYLLKPKSELKDSSKVYFDFKGADKSKDVREKSTKPTKQFEDEYGYLIDKEFEIIREALRLPVLAVNLNDFGSDRMLLEYMRWLVDGDIVVVESKEEIEQDGRFYVILTNQEIDDIPYLELKRGVLTGWEL